MVAYKAPDLISVPRRRAPPSSVRSNGCATSLPPIPQPLLHGKRRVKPRKLPRPSAALPSVPPRNRRRLTRKPRPLAAAEAAKPPPKKEVVVPTAAELKAARDARYAARKARK